MIWLRSKSLAWRSRYVDPSSIIGELTEVLILSTSYSVAEPAIHACLSWSPTCTTDPRQADSEYHQGPGDSVRDCIMPDETRLISWTFRHDSFRSFCIGLAQVRIALGRNKYETLTITLKRGCIVPKPAYAWVSSMRKRRTSSL